MFVLVLMRVVVQLGSPLCCLRYVFLFVDVFFFFFFQAEDGIRDWSVTGVQTCALPIWINFNFICFNKFDNILCRLWLTLLITPNIVMIIQIGRASCRERV